MNRIESYTEEEVRDILGNTRIRSDKIDGRIAETLTMIRTGEADSRKNPIRSIGQRRRRKRSLWKNAAKGFGAVAAVLLLVLGLCAVNPALAAEIPVVGNIFEKVRDVFSFGRIPAFRSLSHSIMRPIRRFT